MDQTNLNVIVEKHGKWLRCESGGVKAYLRSADMQGANLQLADLQWADMQGANLKLATGDPEFIGVSVSNLTWPVWISPRAGDITIGCQTHSFEQWVKWTAKSKEIIAMHSDAADFWARHKKAIIALAGSMRKDA